MRKGLPQAQDAARVIAAEALGHDPGAMALTESRSHYVYVGSDVVVKVIDAAAHSRLDREIALVPSLPAGITAPLLASGVRQFESSEVRYACYVRVPGAAPGMGLPGVDGATARLLAEQAVQRLGGLHNWTPWAKPSKPCASPLTMAGSSARQRCSPRSKTSRP